MSGWMLDVTGPGFDDIFVATHPTTASTGGSGSSG